jgi:hypothetical protein
LFFTEKLPSTGIILILIFSTKSYGFFQTFFVILSPKSRSSTKNALSVAGNVAAPIKIDRMLLAIGMHRISGRIPDIRPDIR